MACVSVKFVSQKVNKVRWQPGDLQGLQPSYTFVTGSWDNDENRICLWRLPGLKKQSEKFSDFDGYPSQAANSEIDGDGIDSEPQLVYQEKHEGDVTDLKFINQDIFLASSSAGSVQAFKLMSGTQKLRRIQQWEGLHRLRSRACPCTSMAASGTDVTTAGEDGRINVLRLEHGPPIRTIDQADSCTINAVTYLKSNQVVTVNATGQMKIWDLRQPDSQPVRVFLLTGEMTALHCVDRHPTQSHLVAAGSQNSVLNMWDLRREKYPVTLFDGHEGPIWEVKFHPTFSDHLFTCSDDGSVLHWNGSGSSSASQIAAQNARSGESIYSSLGLGGLPTKPTPSSPTSPWLASDPSHQVDINHVLPSNAMPVNSLDVEADQLVCGTDGEAVFVVQNLGLR
ncbi:nucleoporin Nup43-like [Acanthaster planci]|uniref:Nucleoporin Nup43-like n=1 Tax=Acanthaster planci TaxID=133434 RepID=A0A8B7ZU74_ACAPL|nr:nucleoporin Nup43-like [Acanthaster planci]